MTDYNKTSKVLLDELKQKRPEVSVRVTWEIDPYYEWDGDGELLEDMIAHNVDVKALTIINGVLLEGVASLGGCYSNEDGSHDPEIHGYFPQLLEEALEDLDSQIAKI